VREQKLLTEVLTELRKLMPMPLLGFDTDNDAVFINETVHDYCQAESIAFTRCRPYRKNDQAWVEQKNGAVVRRIVGYRRFEGLEAAAALARLYATVRLFVNFFQPSVKLAEKSRDGARVKKRYHPAATPFQRLLADSRVAVEIKEQTRAVYAVLDPVALLREMRAAQQHWWRSPTRTWPMITSQPRRHSSSSSPGCARRGRRAKSDQQRAPHPKSIRLRRRPDPFSAVDGQLREWFAIEPWRTSRELLERLQSEYPGVYPDQQLRTLQRRVKTWRRTIAQRMIFGPSVERLPVDDAVTEPPT
jgi:hypothetical protein